MWRKVIERKSVVGHGWHGQPPFLYFPALQAITLWLLGWTFLFFILFFFRY